GNIKRYFLFKMNNLILDKKITRITILIIILSGFVSSQILARPGTESGSHQNTVRVYWIAAEEVLWDYAPSFPVNPMTGNEFTKAQRVFVEQGIGRRYLKSVYREYTEGFGAIKQRTPEEAHLGMLGPLIRAEVGDEIIVHFRNATRF